tara:strand:+ start:58 stop:945 length:888 start_codon:yes stop_codon:yes gene_type:complete
MNRIINKKIYGNNKMKPTIHFILPGGGVKGCFQAGFLYHLFKYFPKEFSLYQLDGCSVGALNGFAVCGGNIEELKRIWDTISCRNDIFESQSIIPIWNSIKTLYKGFYYNGVYYNNLQKKINNYEMNKINEMDKFNCVCVNIKTGICEYKNGLNEKIREYVYASSNPWIVASPVTIEDDVYTDGALLETYPIEYIEKSTADLIVIVGYDEEHFEKCEFDESENIMMYLSRLIDICRNNNKNLEKTKEKIKKHKNIILIDSPMKVNVLYFDKEIIEEGFNMGMQASAKFVLQYLNK